MRKPIQLLALVVVLIASGAAHAAEETTAEPELPRVEIATSMGTIVVELFPDKAPLSVKNFLSYVREGFYDGTIFHRVMPGFMVQGGGFDEKLQMKPPAGQLMNEADNGLSNKRGTIAMARKNEPHTATCQFFINHVDNPGLDHRGKFDGATWGYAVFGHVIAGMDVVDAIAEVETGAGPKGMRNVPVEPVMIDSAAWINGPAEEEPAATTD